MQTNLDLLNYLRFGDDGQPILVAPNQAIAQNWVRRRYLDLAAWALKFGYEVCQVRYPGGTYQIPGQLAMTEALTIANPQVYALAQTWSRESVQLLNKMIETPAPQTLIRLSDQRQVWCNQPFADLMRQTGQEVIQKSIVDYWLPEDLERLRQMLRVSGDRFEIAYRAQLNDDPNLWGSLVARNERLCIDGQWYRLSTNLANEVIASPHAVTPV